MPVKVGGKTNFALIDCGSMVTTIAKSFYDPQLSHIDLQPLSQLMGIGGAGGQSLPYLGYVEFDVKLRLSSGESEGISVPPSRSNSI